MATLTNTTRACAAAMLALALPLGAAPADAPRAEVVAEARTIVEAMKKNPRGPYARLRWYCADGTVHPPMPYPCEARGGGMQHGEYSAERKRLADLGWHVGTIFAATPFEELWEGERKERLRELPLERYAVGVDDGFVLRQARTYRGRVQIEDEEAKGRELLLGLMGERAWVAENFLVAREAVRTIPHAGASGDRTTEVRRLTKQLAEVDKSFETLRVKIHNDPAESDIAAVRAWIEAARKRGASASSIDLAERSIAEMESIYGAKGRAERLASASTRLAAVEGLADEAAALDGLAQAGARERLSRLAAAMRATREAIEGAGLAPETALALMDLSLDLEIEAVRAGFDVLEQRGTSRADLLAVASDLVDAAHGAGLLSARERDELQRPARALAAGTAVSSEEYLAAARALERAATWAMGAVRHAFAEPLARYAALEPKTARFPEDLLRGSAMLPLAEVAGRLARDAERQMGLLHRVFGEQLVGVAGLNPGAAVGTLRVAGSAAAAAKAGPHDVVVLPETVSELPPVAGILTVSEGNALSHVQMLARNLGIPNAVVPALAVEPLSRHAGERVLFAVGTGGSVVLAAASGIDRALVDDVVGTSATDLPRVDAPVPDLSRTEPIPLADLHAGLSGKLVGPKAANLGELARHFPGRVAPALALPFGIYAQHAASGEGSPKARLDAAFARHRAGEIDDAALAAEVEAVRKAVEALAVDPAVMARIAAWLEAQPGGAAAGVFVRSDTNVEDLPQFTGAGLNRTVPHVVGLEAIAAAIPKVWASPFTERAMAWRARALTRPEEVYPSVLLMQSVPAEKSGVLVTRDVVWGRDGATVTMAWGVGGGVDGEVSETLVLRPDGTQVVVSESKAPYRRALAQAGGVAWNAAPPGRVLTEGEVAQVRDLLVQLDERLTPATGEHGERLPWDVELGFRGGELVLFQVRPLVEKGARVADRVVAALAPSEGAGAPTVDMTAPPAASAAASARTGGSTRTASLTESPR